MKLTFFGAAHAVTGSCHCLEVNGKKILIDCGLQQGRDEHDDNTLDFAPNYIDYVLVTHAHIDHSGRIPLLVKEGFNGRILTTGLTAQLMSVMLRDSAHIQEGDANWHNQKGKRAGLPPVEPLYTLMDAEEAIHMLETVEYGWLFDLCEGSRSGSATRATCWAPPFWKSGPPRTASPKRSSSPATWATRPSPSSGTPPLWTAPTM